MKQALFTWGNFPLAAEHFSLYRRKTILKANAKHNSFLLAMYTLDLRYCATCSTTAESGTFYFFFKGQEIPEEEDTHDLHSLSELSSSENHQIQSGTVRQSIGGQSVAAGSC